MGNIHILVLLKALEPNDTKASESTLKVVEDGNPEKAPAPTFIPDAPFSIVIVSSAV